MPPTRLLPAPLGCAISCTAVGRPRGWHLECRFPALWGAVACHDGPHGQKRLGIIPEGTELTERPDPFPAWDSLSDAQKKLYAWQMEVFAGYSENADWNVGPLLDAIQEMEDLDNTLIFYIWGDNGASMEGTITGSFNELTFLNGVVLDAEQQLQLIEQ